ncbi:unnamed protein product [Paramecium pentaurelia]|uniref:Uncharacterized protein n=1 Tax=Paramecium pentaurelia TaxID=43138 RepID=A0A8S1TWY4_9CILI|nr:unnamed protein product [Paramecium pentaurelia]
MSELQNKYRITSRPFSADKILITLQNLDYNTQQQNTLQINHLTTIQDVKQSILNNLEHLQNIELYFQQNQPFIGNLNELVLNKIKQANTRIIYYKVVKKRNNSQPQNSNNYQQPKLVITVQEQKVQQQQTSVYQKNMITPAQSNPQNFLPQLSNNQGNIIFNTPKNQPLKNTLQKLQIQYNDLEKQNQELANEKKLIQKQILKNSLKIQDLEQENINLSKLNQKLTDELALLKYNQSEFENLKFENQQIKDQINQIRLNSEQILMEKNKLQEQISKLVLYQFLLNKAKNVSQIISNKKIINLIKQQMIIKNNQIFFLTI